MDTNRFAILIDGGYAYKLLRKKLARAPEVADIAGIAAAACRQADLLNKELLRAYYYDASPATGTVKNPASGARTVLGKTEVFRRMSRLHLEIENLPDFSVRRGEARVRGMTLRSEAVQHLAITGRRIAAEDFTFDIEQKGVDLRIGLDIARIALRGLAGTIVVFTGDSDLVPAFKFARREGVRVYLDPLEGSIRPELRLHADRQLDCLAVLIAGQRAT
jgi:uncharacterized LabA/DUF88 family protein